MRKTISKTLKKQILKNYKISKKSRIFSSIFENLQLKKLQILKKGLKNQQKIYFLVDFPKFTLKKNSRSCRNFGAIRTIFFFFFQF